jgi:arylsulfatase A-like enzyme
MSDAHQRPNIVIIYADDLGFGDLSCYGATHLGTPNLDKLAAQGLQFTQGYATAATCTPSRYSLLTGSYPWRNPDARILAGDAPMIIPTDMPTLPRMLRQAGYSTGIVGKWHLGLGRGDLDWNADIAPSPLDVGFDTSFIMAATNDRVPCVYVDGRRVAGLVAEDPIEVNYNQPFPGLPTGRDNPELLRMKYSHGHDMALVNGISRIGYMRGGMQALWKDEEMAEVFLEKALSFVNEHQDEPFFLYYVLHQPHVPRVPGPRFAGTTGLGPRGDVIAELDWCVGEMLDTLDQLGLAEKTIVIFSSDNGPVLDDGYQDQAVELSEGHRPAGPLRGGKYSLFDGGTRVPLLVRWVGRIAPAQTAAKVCHVDFFASFAALLQQSLEADAAVDSLDMLSAFLGTDPVGRLELVVEGAGAKTILHRGDWVFIPPYKGPGVLRFTGIESGNAPHPQLYNLRADTAQQENLASAHPAVVEKMASRLIAIQQSERTRP